MKRMNPPETQKRFTRYTVPIVLVAALIVGCTLWWKPGLKIPSAKLPISAKSIVTKALPDYSDVDLEQQRLLIYQDVAKQHADGNRSAATLGAALLRLAELELAVGTCEESEAALREVSAIHTDKNDWQARQATRQLDDLRVMADRSEVDREQWRDACRKLRQAESLHAKGRFLEGILLAEEVLTKQRALWGDTHANVADSLLRLAWLCTEHSDHYIRANDLARNAAETTRMAYGESHPAYGDCQFVRATLADDRGEFDEADRLYEDALAIYKDSVGEMSRQYARALSHQGRMYGIWWKEFASSKLFRADYIRQQILNPQDPDRAESLEFLAQTQYAIRQFLRAEDLLNQALEIRVARQGSEHPDLAYAKSALGVCLGMHGESSRAALFTYDALDLNERVRGPKHPKTIAQRCMLGKVKHYGMGDYAGAYREYERALHHWRELRLESHPHFCNAILSQVEALSQMVTHARDTGAPQSDRSWQLAYAMMDRAQEAVRAYQALPQGNRLSVSATLRLLNAHYLTNFSRLNRTEAEDLLVTVERTVTKHGGELHPAYLQLLNNQELLLQSQGKTLDAVHKSEEILRRHLEIWGKNDPWEYAGVCMNLSDALIRDVSQLDRAQAHAKEAFDTVLNLFQKDGLGQSGSARLTMLGDCFNALSVALSVAGLQHDLSGAYDQVLAVKGSVSSLQIADRVNNDHQDLVELKSLRESAHAVRQDLKAIAFSDDTETDEWTERLIHASDLREIAENRLALENRPLAPAETVVTWNDVQRALPHRTAFVDFLQYVRHSAPPTGGNYILREPVMIAFITTTSGPPVCVELGLSRPIRAAVSGWRRAIQQYHKDGASNIEHPTQTLANLIWKPLLEHLTDIDTLLIAPDGPLCFVSFAALPGRHPDTYALEDYAIHYTNSGRWLCEQFQNDRNRPSGTGLLLCGDIEYHTEDQYRNKVPSPSKKRQSSQTCSALLPNVEDINNLKTSGPEIDAIREQFTRSFGDQAASTTLNKAAATEARMRAALERNWKCIHFAGHGLFISPENAGALTGQSQLIAGSRTTGPSNYFVERNQLLLSGLVLAAATPQDKKPGFLTAEDLGSLDLRQTDLVVLSACDTGLGCTAGGDGVLGLTRSFLTAGVRSVVSSLWKVDDAATCLLMQEFYKNLWERGLPKSEALRQAQLSLLRDASLIEPQRNNLIAQLKRSLPDLGEDELRYELAHSNRGLVPGFAEDIDESAGDERLEETPGTSSNISRTHPALWAAFILNGDAR